jgi:DNA repair exonuclease SbcCD nuclease subunit
MKFVFITDIHCKESGKLINDLPESIYYARENLLTAATLAAENKCDYLVIGGDMVEDKKYLHQLTITNIQSVIDEISRRINVIILIGNHDYVVVNGKQVTFLEGLASQRVKVITGYEIIDDVAFISHHFNRDVLRENVFECCRSCDIIVSHFGLNEGVMSNNMRVQGEFSISEFSIFTDDKLFILGHYHKPQEVVYKNNRAIYVGSCQPVRADEFLDNKRFILFNSSNREIVEYPTLYRRCYKLVVEKLEDEASVVNQCKKLLSEFNCRVYVESHVVPSRTIIDYYMNSRDDVYLSVKLQKNSTMTLAESNEVSSIDVMSCIEDWLKQNNVYNEKVMQKIREV